MKSQYKYPDSKILYRAPGRKYPVVSHGEGPYLYDEDGKRYFDAVGGAMVVTLGHGPSPIADAITQQVNTVSYVNGTQFLSRPLIELAEELSDLAPGNLSRVTLLSSGSECIEAAAKFVRQLWVERGEVQRDIFIARDPSYHGNTLFALSASGRPHYKAPFLPMLSNVHTVPTPMAYRFRGGDYEKDGAQYFAWELEDCIKKAGKDRVAGFLVEPIGGSSVGAAQPPPNYFKKIREVCDRYQIPIIADEVLCGSGRTGKFFASEHFDFEPDVLVAGKGLSAGYVPVSALIVREDHFTEMVKGSGSFKHAQTFMQAPVLAATALATLRYIKENNVLENAASVGAYMQKRLREELGSHQHIGALEGRGMLAGVEIVEDKESKVSFDRSKKTIEALSDKLFESGVIVWPNSGHVDGLNGDLFMLGPPLNSSIEQIDELVLNISAALKKFF